MSNFFESFFRLCSQFVIKFAPAPARSESPQPPSSSTSNQTPSTDSGTSAKNVTKPSVVNRNPRLTENQALAVAEQVVGNWLSTGEEPDPAILKQMVAQNVLNLTDRAAHLGSIATMNEVMWASHQVYQDGSPETLHLRAAEQGHIANDLMVTLQEVDGLFVLIATSLNDLLARVEDEEVRDHLTKLRHTVMMADEAVRERIEGYSL